MGRFILGPLFKLYYHPTIIGKEHIPSKGPIIIVGNHKHIYDQCLTIISTKRGISYLAKKEYFDSKMAWFFKAVGCISVDRKHHDQQAKDLAIDVLKKGGAVGLFPEGTRNKTNKKLLPFKFGAVSMAKKTESYLVPFAIVGDYRFKSRNLTIKYGIPFKVGDMDLDEANQKLYQTVEKLMDEINKQ